MGHNPKKNMSNGLPLTLQGPPPEGMSKEEQLWQEASACYKKRWFLRLPNEVILLSGLVVAVAIIAHTLYQFSPQKMDFMPQLQKILTAGFPIALGTSAFFMCVGLVQRWLNQRVDDRRESTYRQLLEEYENLNQMEKDISDNEKRDSADLMNDFLDELREFLDKHFENLGTKLDSFEQEVAARSGIEIEGILNRFAESIHDLPDKLANALSVKLEEPLKERSEFRMAVSQFMSWPVELNKLNEKFDASTASLKSVSEDISNLNSSLSQEVNTLRDTAGSFSQGLTGMDETLGLVDKRLSELGDRIAGSDKVQEEIHGALKQLPDWIVQSLEPTMSFHNEMISSFLGNLNNHFQSSSEEIHALNLSVTDITQSSKRSEAVLQETKGTLIKSTRAIGETVKHHGQKIVEMKDALNGVRGNLSKLHDRMGKLSDTMGKNPEVKNELPRSKLPGYQQLTAKMESQQAAGNLPEDIKPKERTELKSEGVKQYPNGDKKSFLERIKKPKHLFGGGGKKD